MAAMQDILKVAAKGWHGTEGELYDPVGDPGAGEILAASQRLGDGEGHSPEVKEVGNVMGQALRGLSVLLSPLWTTLELSQALSDSG